MLSILCVLVFVVFVLVLVSVFFVLVLDCVVFVRVLDSVGSSVTPVLADKI